MNSPWTATITLRILMKEGKRQLQQRWTRCCQSDIDAPVTIEEKWVDVPTVCEDEK